MELLSRNGTDMDTTVDVLEASTPTPPGIATILSHIRNPQNMLNYMILTAWLKFMGIAQHIPSVTIG